MPRFPDWQDLGQLPNMGGQRAVASYNAMPIAQGGEAIGQAVGQGGAAIAKAVGVGGQEIAQGESKLGAGVEQVGEAGQDLLIDKGRYEYATAHANFLSQKIDLDSAMSKDQDYSTLSDRYDQQINQLRDNAASSISLPGLRDRFNAETQPQVEQGIAGANKQALGLEGQTSIASATAQGDKFIDQATSTNDPQTRAQIIAAHAAQIDGLQARGFINPEQALAMKQTWAHQYALADGIARADTDPQGVINDLRAAPGSDDATINRILQVEGTSKNAASSATGGGQFVDGTWLDMIKKYRPDLAKGQSDQDLLAMRADSSLTREMTGHYLDENRASLQSQGLPTTPGALYLAHFLGPKGAAAVLAADPNAPVAKALSDSLGPQAAARIISANPSVLYGKQVSSVTQWADSKMGGATAGGVNIYDYLRPDQRALLLDHAEASLNKQSATDLSGLKQRVEDTLTEANNNGIAQNPVSQAEFIGGMGVAKGQQAFQDYQSQLKLGSDLKRVAGMTPQQQSDLLDQYEPKAGEPGYADQAARQAQLVKAIGQKQAELGKDPAAYAIKNLPASSDAWNKLSTATADPTVSADDKAPAARNYATQTQIEQARAGVPETAQRITPKGYAEQLAAQWKQPDTAGGPGVTLQKIQGEAALWGDAWPQVYREISPKLDPTLRVIAGGVEPAAGKALLENQNADEAKILGTQYDVKKADLDQAVTRAIAPLAKTFVGTQADQTREDYMGTARKLAAIYIARGQDAGTAATQAVSEIAGSRYDLQDTYRIPHSAAVSPAQVGAGVAAARANIGNLDVATEKDNVGGLSDDYLKGATSSALARDGKWVTSPDEKGLMLVYKDGAWPSKADPSKPFSLTWSQLADMGAGRKGAPPPAPVSGDLGAAP